MFIGKPSNSSVSSTSGCDLVFGVGLFRNEASIWEPFPLYCRYCEAQPKAAAVGANVTKMCSSQP